MRAIAMVVLAAGVLGCGESSARRADEAGTAGQDTEAEAAAGRSACELATESEIAALAGEPVRAKQGRQGRNFSKCLYMGTVNGVPYVELTAYFRDGREAFEVYRSAMGMAADLMQSAENVELDSIVKPGPVPGLGDAAVFAELGPSVVLDGDRYLELMLFHLPDARAKFRPLAELLLSRM